MREIRHGYERERCSIDTGSDSNVKQAFKDECDINAIVARYGIGGVVPTLSGGVFADVSQIGDYRNLCDRMAQIKNVFDSLPSQTRAWFENDPANMVAFLADPENLEAAREMGLVYIDENGVVADPPSAEPAPQQSADPSSLPATEPADSSA